LFLLLLAAGCGGGNPPAAIGKKGIAPVSDVKKGEVAKPPDAKAVDTEKKDGAEYSYSPAGKPDPFKPFIQLAPVREARNVPLTPLQKYEISQLKLVAIIAGKEGNIGLVEDSAGKGYFLKKGTEIGKNDGRVTKIMKDRVIVEEAYQDVLGATKMNEIPLILHQTEEGGGS
jgi:type IV pilus assembly protein PilP